MISIFEVSLDKKNDMNYTSIIVSLDKKRYGIYIEYSKRYGNHIFQIYIGYGPLTLTVGNEGL